MMAVMRSEMGSAEAMMADVELKWEELAACGGDVEFQPCWWDEAACQAISALPRSDSRNNSTKCPMQFCPRATQLHPGYKQVGPRLLRCELDMPHLFSDSFFFFYLQVQLIVCEPLTRIVKSVSHLNVTGRRFRWHSLMKVTGRLRICNSRIKTLRLDQQHCERE